MKKALSIRNLHKTYDNGFTALKGVDIEVEEGDFFALLGPNGAGKSTIIGILSSLIRKTAGDVSILGYDIDTDFEKAKRYLGLVPQEFNFNIFEPVVEIVANQAGYFGIERKKAFENAEFYLRELSLWDKRNEQARNLSGGMKRRLMIARALVHNPSLLILDEPTAGVDIEIRRSMWAFLRRINAEGTTIILTTHYLEEAESLCRNIAIIDNGEIVENTSMKNLLGQLHSETFVLDLINPLDKAPVIANFPVTLRDSGTLEVEVEKGCNINHLFAALDGLGIAVSSLRSKTNRLEQLFVSRVKTGQSVSGVKL
ncbi:MAG: ABC transporter ATP-binding protein [Gammaproteobacteria bacterium]|nr:ABC transporter ATP-binding protein [Gammaproteobacteria bacterium]